jgi:hypothetical protein
MEHRALKVEALVANNMCLDFVEPGLKFKQLCTK